MASAAAPTAPSTACTAAPTTACASGAGREFEEVVGDVQDGVLDHLLQLARDRLRDPRQEFIDDAVGRLVDDALDQLAHRGRFRGPDKGGQAACDDCEAHADAQGGGHHAEFDLGLGLHPPDDLGDDVTGVREEAGDLGHLLQVSGLHHGPVLLEGLDRRALAGGQDAGDCRVRLRAVPLELVGELPHGIGHFAVVVLVHVRPVDPDEVQDLVHPARQDVAHPP